MGKELEIKILDIDIEETLKKLNSIGATFSFDELQKIYTYDFQCISSDYFSIVNDLRFKKSQKVVTRGIKRLQQLCFDIDDLINEFDENDVQRNTIEEVFGVRRMTDIVAELSYDNTELIDKFLSDKISNVFMSYSVNPNKWIRLRQTGNKCTFTIKHILGRYTDENGVRHHDVNNVLEYEVPVSDLEGMKKNLELLGYYHKNYQEKRRIQYQYQGLEIDIDLWPHIPAYMEIEADSFDQIMSLVDELRISHGEIVSMNTDDVYRKYGIDMYQYKELKF